MAENPQPLPEDPEFEQQRIRFYALIGLCLTRYHNVEDYLPDLFAAVLGGDTERARAIFSVARSLEAKLNIISAALMGAPEPQQACWSELLPRIASAAQARNQMAHGTARHYAGSFVLQLGENLEPTSFVAQSAPARMELLKHTPKGEHVWTLEKMKEELARLEALFGEVIAFAKEIKGEGRHSNYGE